MNTKYLMDIHAQLPVFLRSAGQTSRFPHLYAYRFTMFIEDLVPLSFTGELACPSKHKRLPYGRFHHTTVFFLDMVRFAASFYSTSSSITFV